MISVNKNFLYKGLIYFVVLIIVLAFYFFLLYFYENKIIKKMEEINNLKTKLTLLQSQTEKVNQLRRIENLVKQRTNKDLKSVINEIEKKLNRNLEATKDLISNQLNQENWQIQLLNLQEEYNVLEVYFQIPQNDYDKFFNFLSKEALLWQIKQLRINKATNTYNIYLKLEAK